MKKSKIIIALASILLLAMVFSGCKYIISGTFVIVQDIEFTAESGFYFYQVDITKEADWNDHKDDIDIIDAVGVEFHIISDESANVTFSAYVDEYSGVGSTPTSVPTTATKIIDGLVVPPGETTISYSESLKFLTGIDRLKKLVRTGKFDYFGTSTGNLGTSFVIDKGKVIITFSAS
ncbi:MAG: hypothetical protein CVT49_05105 [candidate division Zixibacteria bacterium HGW-Zixibacteria-1]|nr:MAG: hypothetical protein CVT49_05105 [candidate division Zixibacteria bacterium HGW-Zixibacteria-1]